MGPIGQGELQRPLFCVVAKGAMWVAGRWIDIARAGDLGRHRNTAADQAEKQRCSRPSQMSAKRGKPKHCETKPS